jgi:hypothetical protein
MALPRSCNKTSQVKISTSFAQLVLTWGTVITFAYLTFNWITIAFDAMW